MTMKNENISSEKVLKKFSPCERREILKAFQKLYQLIETEEASGCSFETLFNNAQIKYDIFGSNFFTFKSQGRDRSQIRILYKFRRESNGEFHLELHRVFIKRRDSKEYIKDFAKYVQKYTA